MNEVANTDVFAEPFVLVALGAWAAILIAFFGQTYGKTSRVTHLLLACSILTHAAGVLALWGWAHYHRLQQEAGVLALIGVALPVVGLILFAIAILRKANGP